VNRKPTELGGSHEIEDERELAQSMEVASAVPTSRSSSRAAAAVFAMEYRLSTETRESGVHPAARHAAAVHIPRMPEIRIDGVPLYSEEQRASA
jgi:hypothetical protein